MAAYINLNCSACKKTFSRLLKQFTYQKKKGGDNYSPLCSQECKKNFRSSKVEVNCGNCNKIFKKLLNQIGKTKNNFCNHSCAASFENKKRLNLPIDKIIHCKYCSKEIFISESSLKEVCDNCKIEKSREASRKANTDIKTLCLKCGIEILSYGGKTKYCEPCRQEVYSLNALKRVNEDINFKKLKSIHCFYLFKNKLIRCDSKAEFSCLNYVESNFKILDMNRSSLILSYELENKIRRYNPDFEVKLEGGQIMFVECKTVLSNKDLQRKWNIYYKSIIPKKEALILYCKENGFEYLFFNKDMNKRHYNSISRDQLQIHDVS